MDVREKTTSTKRLIDADALLNEFLKRYTERERNKNLVFAACEIKQDFADMISDFPTVDAVEVVRCKDCRMATEDFMIDGWYHCENNLMTHMPDCFCSYGEKRE